MKINKTPYQQNLQQEQQPAQTQQSPQKWYAGDQPTSREMYGQIGNIYKENKMIGKALAMQFSQLQQDASSPYYNPYTQATNHAVGTLQSYGIDTNTLTADWFNQNQDWQQYLRRSSANSILAPTKKSSDQEIVAYNLYQFQKSMADTEKMETEWNALKEELTYKAGQKDRPWSDDEIIGSIDWDKYSTLKKMYSADENGTPNIYKFNKASEFSTDAMYGVLWAARNEGGTGNLMSDIVLSAMGEGNQWEDNPELRAKLNWNDKSTYDPYSVGASMDENVLMYFGKYTYEQSDVDRIRRTIDPNDKTAVENFQKIASAVTDTQTAQQQAVDLQKQVDSWLKYGNLTADEVINKLNMALDDPKLNKKYSMLKKMDESIQNGTDLVQFTAPVSFNRGDMERYIRERCEKRIQTGNGGTFIKNIKTSVNNGTTNQPETQATVAPADMEVDAVSGADVVKPNPFAYNPNPKTVVAKEPAKKEENPVPNFVYKGNIDIDHRPVVDNGDGTFSTEESFSMNFDGKEVLIPTIINGQRVSDEEAIQHYLETGENLGVFDTPEEAETYAQDLHLRQEWFYGSQFENEEPEPVKNDLDANTGKTGIPLSDYIANAGSISDVGFTSPGPEYTDADIDTGMAKDHASDQAAAAMEGYATEDEMAGWVSNSFFYNGTKQFFNDIVNGGNTFDDYTKNMLRFSSEEGTRTYFDASLKTSRDIYQYEQTEKQLAEDRIQYDEYQKKYGKIEYLYTDPENGKVFEQSKDFQVGDINVSLHYNDKDKQYEIASMYAPDRGLYNREEIEYYNGINGQDTENLLEIERLVKEYSREEREINAAHQKLGYERDFAVNRDGEAGGLAYDQGIEEYKALDAKIRKEEQFLAENKAAYADNRQAMNAASLILNISAITQEWLGMGGDYILQADAVLDDISQYYDQPQLPGKDMSELQTFDEMTGGKATQEERSAYVKEGLQKTEDAIAQLQMEMDYIQTNGFNVPENIKQNMKWKLEDLQNQRKSYEYSKILTDTDPKELADTIQTGKAFETYILNNAKTINIGEMDNILAYGFDGYDDIVRDDEKDIYYYLLGKSAMENAGDYTRLKEEFESSLDTEVREQARETLNNLLKTSSDYFLFLTNDDYGVLTVREADKIAKAGQEEVDDGFWSGAWANLKGTAVSPLESLESAVYLLDRKLNNKRINPKSGARGFSIYKENVRSETYKSIDEKYGDSLQGSLARLGYEIYTNRGDSISNGLVFGKIFQFGGKFANIINSFAGASPMGATAALSAAAKAVENNASMDEAWMIAGVTFLSETLTEAITYSNIQEALSTTQTASKETLKQFFVDWLTQNGLEEAIGESINDLAENAVDTYIGKKSDTNYYSEHQQLVDKYLAEGYGDKAEAMAAQDELKNVMHTAFVSYLSAGSDVAIKAAKSAVNTVSYYRGSTRFKQQHGDSASMLKNMTNDWKKTHGMPVNETTAQVTATTAKSEQATGETKQTASVDQNAAKTKADAKQAMLEDKTANKEQKTAPTEEQKQTAKDVTVIESSRNADTSTQAAAMATALTTESKGGTDYKADAAGAYINSVFGENGATIIEETLVGAAQAGLNIRKVKTAIKNAALGNGLATQLVQSEAFQNATPEQKAQMLLDTLQKDSSDKNVQRTINNKITDFRRSRVISGLAQEGHFQQALADQAAVQKASETTQRTQQNLANQELVEQQAADAVAQANETVTNDPSPDNVEQAHKAVEHLNSQTIVTDQQRQANEKAQQAQDAAEEKAEKSAQDAMTSARQIADQQIAQEDQQIAEQEEQARVAEEQAEAERVAAQEAEDERTGVAEERRQDAAIEQAVEQQNLEPKQAEERTEALKARRTQIKERLVDLRKPVSNVEGMLAVQAFGRKLGMNIEFADMDESIRGKYQNGTIYLNQNRVKAGKMSVGQALVEAVLHEITHAMENTGNYTKYRSVVLRGMYGDNMTGDVNTDYQNNADYRARIDSIIEQRKNGVTHETMTPEQADQEIVADFARLNLAQKDVVQRFMDAGMGGNMRNILHNINQALKNFFGRLTGDERKTAEYLRKAERAFQKAMNDVAKASVHPEGNQFSVMQFAQAAGLTFNENTLQLYDADGNEIDGVKNKVTADMIDKTPVGMLINSGLTGDQQNDAREMMAGLMNMVARYKDSNLVWEIGATTLSSTFSALKSNSDPQYKTTVDFGTVCAKTQAIIDTMSKVMLDKVKNGENGGLTREDIMKVYNAVNKAGLSVPCPVCYVFSRWMGVPSLLGQMSQYQHDFVVTNEDGTINKEETQKKVDTYLKNAEQFGDAKAINNQKVKLQNKLTALEQKRMDLEAKAMDKKLSAEQKADIKSQIKDVLGQMVDIDNQIGEVSAYNWITQALCKKDSNGKFVVDNAFKLTPDEILFDLNRTGEFAGYEKNWKYRNTRGAGMGKAIMPYSGETIGDVLYGVKKGGRQNSIKNPWLNMDDKAAARQLKNAQDRAKKQNLVGGQRLQSTSDFRPEWGLDYIMSFLELQAAKSKVQMYTKVAEAVDFFASVGADVNLSIMGKGQGWHIDENGKYVLDFSDITGMKFETAKELKDKYDNVQMILVGMNDTHIRLALANDDIDFVIPWHSSGNSKEILSGLISAVGEKLDSSVDYTTTQADMVKGTTKKYTNEKGEKVEYTAPGEQTTDQKALWDARMKLLTKGNNALTEADRKVLLSNKYTKELYRRFTEKGYDDECYGVKLVKEQANQIFPYEYWDTTSTKDNADVNGQRFVEYCEAMGIVPRFSQFKDDPGYWKLLIDRPMYNNDGTYHEQQVIDVTNARIGALNEEGQLTGSDLPTQAQAKYAPKDPRNPNYEKYTEAQKKAIEYAEAALDLQYDDGTEGQYSVYGDMTEADIDLLDEDYLAAVERGDMEAAQEDVDFVAEQNGYAIKAYHGTPDANGIGNYFDPNKAITGPMPFFTESERLAEEYAHNKQLPDKTYFKDQYKIGGVPIIDWWDSLPQDQKDDIAQKARNIVVKNGDITINPNDRNSAAEFDEEVDAFNGNVMLALSNTWLDSNRVTGEGFAEMLNLLGIDDVEFINPRSEKVYSTYLKIQKPFDVATMYTKEFLEDLEDWWMFEGSRFEEKPEMPGWHKNNVNVYDWVAQGLETDIPYGQTVNWTMIPDGVVEYLKELGYDGIKDQSGKFGGDSETVWIPFNSEQIKSSDPVTYDDNGNVIPPSERFNMNNPDIRYSTGDIQTEADNDIRNITREYNYTDVDLDQTLVGSGAVTQEELERLVREESKETGEPLRQWGTHMAQEMDELAQQAREYVLTHSAYQQDTNQEQINRAFDWIKGLSKNSQTDPFTAALTAVTNKNFNYRSADGQARMAAVMGMAIAKNDVPAQVMLADAVNKQGTDLGQALQARKLFRLMTPEGRVATLQKMLNDQQAELDRKGIKLDKDLKFSDWVIRAAAVAESDGDFQQVQQAAIHELAEQIPADWKDRVRSLRMLSMLANPRTHIRNIIGNAMFVPAVSLKNKLGAIGELVFKQKDRTKTLSMFASKEERNFARADAETMRGVLTGEAKYNEATQVKKAQGKLGTFMDAIGDFNSNLLEGEDWFFLKGHYRRALSGWIHANGYTVEQLQNIPSLLEKGRAYAIDEAQKATYRDFNKTAQTLNQISQKGGLTGFLVDAALPFKKTPANILRRGLEYSPVGIVKSLTSDMYHMKQWFDYQNGKLNALPDKAMSPTQVIDHFCSGLSGTAICALGYLLAGTGAVSAGLDDDEDKLEKAKGLQEYSVNFGKAANNALGLIGVPRLFGEDVTYTMDWAAPISMPLFVGAAIREMNMADGDANVEEILNALGNITEPVFNLSMLDGINSLFKTSQYDDTNTITQIGAKILSNYATSYVPSLFGAIARTIDDKQRKSFVEQGKGTGVMGTFRYALEQAQNKIPFYNQQNIAVRDIWGNEKTSSLAERIFENFISPGYMENYRDDPILNEMSRLYEVTGDSGMIPKEDPDKSITVNKEKRVLTAEQWDQYKATRNQTAFNELTELINSTAYKNATDASQVQMIKDIWSHADKVGKNAVFPDFEIDSSKGSSVSEISTNSLINTYKNDMVKALKAENYSAFDTMVQALRDHDVPDTQIKQKIADAYRDEWKKAYRAGNRAVMAEIENILDYTGFDFAYDDWAKQEDKKQGKN